MSDDMPADGGLERAVDDSEESDDEIHFPMAPTDPDGEVTLSGQAYEQLLLAAEQPLSRPGVDMESLLESRIAQADSAEVAGRWMDVLQKHREVQTTKERTNVVLALEFLRFVAIVGLGCALIAFGMEEVGFLFISTQILPSRRWSQFQKLIREGQDHEE